MSDTTREPVLWVLDFDGHPLHPDFVFASAEEAENYKRHTISHCQIVPLFRHPPQPTLTDAEREDLQMWLAECLRQCSAATEGGNAELAERWQWRAKRAAAMK